MQQDSEAPTRANSLLDFESRLREEAKKQGLSGKGHLEIVLPNGKVFKAPATLPPEETPEPPPEK